jgi:RNA polymerase sigma-70 factor (ECF subfamily)
MTTMQNAQNITMTTLSDELLAEVFRAHERFLWGLCYRLTGNAADADDLVQETFVRALKSPPANLAEPWRPWLARVAVNLGRDLLRRRCRQVYDGPWLPSPLETGDETEPPAHEPTDERGNPATRYDLLESVSFAFLLALEALTPAQRAVLLLRDVFDYSVRETAAALDITEANVKTTHLRARKAMRAYEQARPSRSAAWQERAQQTLAGFLRCLANHDVTGIETLLASDVRAFSDGGGEFFAARVPLSGREKVFRFYSTLARQLGDALRLELKSLNGAPAFVLENLAPQAGYARRSATLFDFDGQGRIKRIYSVLATRKLTALS